PAHQTARGAGRSSAIRSHRFKACPHLRRRDPSVLSSSPRSLFWLGPGSPPGPLFRPRPDIATAVGELNSNQPSPPAASSLHAPLLVVANPKPLCPKNACSTTCKLPLLGSNTESHCSESTTIYDKNSPPSGAPKGRNTESDSTSTQKRRRQNTGIPHRTRGRTADRGV